MRIPVGASRFLGVDGREFTLWLLIVAQFGVVAAVAARHWDGHFDQVFDRPLLVAGVFVLFAIAQSTELRFEVGRQGVSTFIADIPLVIGLFYVHPVALLAARLLASVLWGVSRRLTFTKSVFNVAMMTAEAGVAVAIFYAMPAGNGITDPNSWITTFAAVIGADLVSTLATVIAISLVQGPMSAGELVRMVIAMTIAVALNATVGLIVVIVLDVNPWTAVLVLMVAAVVIAGYRAYAQFLRQHRSLENLYEFTRAVGTTRQVGTLADAMLERTRELLNAEAAALWLPGTARHPEVLLRTTVDSPAILDEPGASPTAVARQRVQKTGKPLLVTRGEKSDFAAQLRSGGVKDLVAVPLRSGDAVIGVLKVRNRLGDVGTFTADDQRMLETLAAHTTVAVENTRLVERLRFDASHDQVTGLANRRRLLAAIEESLGVRPAPNEVVAVMQFDVNSLRDVNETLGHSAGDALLVEVGRRLERAAPPGSLVARTGGDEFGVLLRTNGAQQAVATASALKESMAQPYRVGTMSLEVAAAVGVVLAPDHGNDPAILLQRAEIAMYAAKSNPRSVQTYSTAMESRSVRRLGLVSDLRRALDSGEFGVHFQPMITLADREIAGVECLLRWNHPDHGAVSPDDFIPVAEHTGLLRELTTQVLGMALNACQRWRESGRPLGVSVNLSARTLSESDFPTELERLLGESDRPIPALHRLRELGVRLSVDDFGTGYSSLAYLRRLPVNEVKIDKSFIFGMATDPSDLAIVRTVVDLARHLGLVAVAEGVESEMTLSLLQDIGCDVAQGFLFSRPLSFERVEAWMAARTEIAPWSAGDDRRLRLVGAPALEE
jgi:diguanylate cyclase (GGDEF)-like protein